MSGIVGIINLDGEPIDPHLLGRMTDFMAFRGPDDRQIWIDGHVGFGHTMLRTTWEAEFERQPFTLDRQVWIVADVRIDDRENLAAQLALPFQPLTGSKTSQAADAITDVELIWHAYRKWGEACVEHLLGDFALAIWDGHKQQLFCARDHFGVKPFYYSRHQQTFLFASSVDALRALPRISSELNEETVGDFLLFAHNQNENTTIYRDILRLPPAHRLIIDRDSCRLERYWNFPSDGKIYYRDRADYVEHYRELFTASVRDRLRSDNISISLSGGMDSSGIAAIAARHSTLQAITYTTGDLLPEDREDDYTKIVAEHLQLPLELFSVADCQLYDRCFTPELYTPQPIDDYRLASSLNFYLRARQQSRILLTGHGGDPLFIGANLYYVSLLKRGKIGRFAKDTIQHLSYYSSLRGLGLVSGLKLALGREMSYRFDYPSWLDTDFAERLSLPAKFDRFHHKSDPISSPHPGAEGCLSMPMWSESFESAYNPYGIDLEIRHPFLDIRLIRFMFAINVGFWGLNKKIHRDAMMGNLPEQIVKRPKTPLAGNLTLELLKQSPTLFDRLDDMLEPVARYIEIDKYRACLRQYRDSGRANYYSLFSPLSLAVWYRSLQSRIH